MADNQAADGVSEADWLCAATFAAQRRCEYLTWRAVLRRELGPVEVNYNAVGAPYILDCNDVHISVSHGAGRVALCISNTPCCVDIERLDRHFDRVSARYLTPKECALSADARFNAVAWCTKEALYKLSGASKLNLQTDLQITAVGVDWIEGQIKNGETQRLSVQYFDDAVVVWKL
ncbi:MAG: 4'-phosphopantetheinyl transferase superfamily protein [Alistipes sp.]